MLKLGCILKLNLKGLKNVLIFFMNAKENGHVPWGFEFCFELFKFYFQYKT